MSTNCPPLYSRSMSTSGGDSRNYLARRGPSPLHWRDLWSFSLSPLSTGVCAQTLPGCPADTPAEQHYKTTLRVSHTIGNSSPRASSTIVCFDISNTITRNEWTLSWHKNIQNLISYNVLNLQFTYRIKNSFTISVDCSFLGLVRTSKLTNMASTVEELRTHARDIPGLQVKVGSFWSAVFDKPGNFRGKQCKSILVLHNFLLD